MAAKAEFPTTQKIGILVFDGFEPIDVFGFVEAFAIARFLGTGYASPPPYPFETVLIAKEIAKVKSANGPSVAPDWDFARGLQQSLDVLMIPGGIRTRPLLDETSDPKSVASLLDWVRAMDKKVHIMASVCTGAAVLAKCGLLDGLPSSDQPFRLWVGGKARTPRLLGQCRAMGRRGQIRHLCQVSRPEPILNFIWYRGLPAVRLPRWR